MLQRSAGGIPGNPEAVRVSQAGFAVVRLQRFRREHVLTIGRSFERSFAVIPCIHQQRAVHSNGLMLAGPIEHDSPAKTPSGCFTGPVQDRIRPDRHHLTGCLILDLFFVAERQRRGVQHAAARRQQCQTAAQQRQNGGTRYTELRHVDDPRHRKDQNGLEADLITDCSESARGVFSDLSGRG